MGGAAARRGLCAVLLLLAPLTGQTLDLGGTRWAATARRLGVDPLRLYAIALLATGRPVGSEAIAPWPWSLRTGNAVRFYPTRAAATAALRSTLGTTQDVGVGLLAVNLAQHRHRVGDPATLLEPGINLLVGAEILADTLASAPSEPALGIGRFRHPGDPAAARRFGARVLALVAALRHGGASISEGDPLARWQTNAVLDLVAIPESRGNYNALYRGADQQAVMLADLTVDAVRALQARLIQARGGSAIGRYQFLAATLERLVTHAGLQGSERFTPALQDRLAGQLAREAGLAAWLQGALPDARFAANLARVWAGLPRDGSNQSAYAGIKGNRATIGWQRVVSRLRAIRGGQRLRSDGRAAEQDGG